MPDYMVLKRISETGQAADWEPTVIARDVEDEEAAAKQGYTGEGTYKVLAWDDDIEAAVAPGEPEVTMVSRSELAEQAAKAVEAAEAPS